MFICEEHGDIWNRDTGCPYCRERKLEQQLTELRGMLQRWFDDCNRGGSDDFSLWDETEALLKQGGE